jgi:hypothetical protein
MTLKDRRRGTPVDYAKDEKFFQVVEELAQRANSEGDARAERRNRQRRPYPYNQYVAAFVGGRMPRASEFEEVRCHDISTGGFSYLSNKLPSHDTMVAAFGLAPGFTYLTAQVRYAKRVTYGKTSAFQVGCKFLGRIDVDQVL